MVRDLVEEAVQSFSSGLNEVIVEALHHAFHHKLLWQWLKTHRSTDLCLISLLVGDACLYVKLLCCRLGRDSLGKKISAFDSW